MSSPRRNVLITGAGSGVGRGLSICLAQQGHTIVATDLNLDTARETVAQIQSASGQAEAHALDVTSESDIQRLLGDNGLLRLRVDTLINNAGLQHVAKLEEFPIEKWNLLIVLL